MVLCDHCDAMYGISCKLYAGTVSFLNQQIILSLIMNVPPLCRARSQAKAQEST